MNAKLATNTSECVHEKSIKFLEIFFSVEFVMM